MPCPSCNVATYRALSDMEVVCEGCGRPSALALWGKLSKKRGRESYEAGSHGAKKGEQKRLKTSGTTHQSEHVVGYEVFGNTVDRGDSQFAKFIENKAPAYQEQLHAHREHIGTGSWKDYKGTGESSEQYRQAQRKLVASRQVGNAVQLNQLYYAFQPEFRDPAYSADLKKADNSYQAMITAFQPVPFQRNGAWGKVAVDATEKAEMTLARHNSRTGSNAGRKEELAAMKRFNIMPGELEEFKPPSIASLARDKHGIPKDGNCLFHSIWASLHSIGINVGFVTSDDMRRQAVGFLRHDSDVQALNAAGTEYLLAMAKPGTWGGELEAFALAHVWGIPITVHGPKYTITYNEKATAPIPIDLYYNGTHYSIGPL